MVAFKMVLFAKVRDSMRLRLLTFAAILVQASSAYAGTILAGSHVTAEHEYWAAGMAIGGPYSGTAPNTFQFDEPAILGRSIVYEHVYALTVNDTTVVTQFQQTGRWMGPSDYDPISFNGWVLSIQGARIGGVTIDPSTNLAGFTAANITYTPTQIRVNLMGLRYTPTTRIQLDLIQAVPEPATWGMLAGGLALAAVLRRKLV
jgi:hypothetical protein